jgi:hypothetical protein
MFERIKQTFKIWSESGIRFPFAYDATTQKPSVTLFFVYISFLQVSIATILLHTYESSLIASIMAAIVWTIAFVFYLLRRLTRAKFDLDDKSIELEGISTDEEDK